MARITKKELEEQLLASEQARKMQEEQMKVMMEFMKKIAETNGIEVPEFMSTQVTSSTTNADNVMEEVQTPVEKTEEIKPVTKRVRKPRIKKETQYKTNEIVGSPVVDQPAIQLLAEEMRVTKEVQVQSNFVESPVSVSDINLESNVEKKVQAYNNVNNEQNFIYKAGRFVGKAMNVVSSFNYSEFLKNTVDKNKANYTEAEKAGFPEEVEYPDVQDPKIQAIEESIAKTSEKSNIRVNFFKRGLNKVMEFVTFNNNERGATAKVAKNVTELFEANGVLFEKNERRDSYLKVIEIKDLATFMNTRMKKDIIHSGNQTEQDLLNSNYQKTSMGFIHNALFELKNQNAGQEVIANYIQEKVFVELRDKLCGTMRLYSDIRLMKNNDKDLQLISEFIDMNYMRCSPSDVIEHLKKNPDAFEKGIFADKKVNPKFVKNINAIIEKCDDYENKACNLYAAMSTYVQAIETQKNIVLHLNISDARKEEINSVFNDERNTFRMSPINAPKEQEKFISFKKIAEVVTEYMLSEVEFIKATKKYKEDLNLAEEQAKALEDLDKIEKSLDNQSDEVDKPVKEKKTRVKKATATSNLEGESEPKKERKKRVVKSKVVEDSNVENDIKESTTQDKTTNNDNDNANDKVIENNLNQEGRRAFLAKRVTKESTQQEQKSVLVFK